MDACPEPLTIPGKLEQIATRIAFFVVGFAVGAWAPLIPLVKARLGLDEAQLGALLLCLGFGSIFAMPFSGGWAAKFGCRKVILAAAAGALAALPVMASGSSQLLVAVALFLFGGAVGVMDVTMNIQAVIVEKASGKAMMSGFHGLYSVGGFVGAGGVTGMLLLNLSPTFSAVVIVVLAMILLIAFIRGLLTYGSHEDTPPFAIPKGKILLIGVLCFIVFLAEGSVLDWSGVFLTSVRNLDEARSGLGYAAFAITMTICRLTGDKIVAVLGAKRILLFGGLTAAFGFLLAVLVPSWLVGILGFALVGVGAANVVPVLFTAAGNQTKIPANLAIAGVTTLGYAGILAGPAMIGFLARATTLSAAISMVAVLLLAVTACAKVVSD